MSDGRIFGRGLTRLATILAGALLPWGCAELALEPDRVPAGLELSPRRVLLESGRSAVLAATVRDRHGAEIAIPSWTPPVWGVSDATVVELGQSAPGGTLTAIGAGGAAVTARVGGLSAQACVHVDAEPLPLTVPVIYPIQAAQNRKGAVPLMAGRPALLRIFLITDRTSFLAPEVRVTLLQDDTVVMVRRVLPTTNQIPTAVDESDLNGSYNLEIPGTLVRPGVGLAVELDPDCKVPIDPRSPVRYPEAGRTRLVVVEPPHFRQVFVPTLWTRQPDMSVFRWLEGIGPESEQMRYTRNLMPVSEVEVEVRDTFWTNADLRTYEGWQRWLNQIRLIHTHEGRLGYYYGVVGSSPSSIAGLGAYGVPWSVGVDRADVYTHEIGHNMDLRHAPCGGARQPDPDYPYGVGSIGIWGYDLENGVLYDPGGYRDVMSYCDPIWISDYHFDRALAHRFEGDGGIVPDGESSSSRGDRLVVWGSVWDGALTMDPAFVLEGPVALPEADGPYRVEGLGAGGETVFSLSFAPTPLEHGGGSFMYFVPYEPAWATALERMVLTGPEGEFTLTRDGEPEMAVVTDPSTGRIRAIVRDWDGGPLPGEATGDVRTTRGIPGGALR